VPELVQALVRVMVKALVKERELALEPELVPVLVPVLVLALVLHRRQTNHPAIRLPSPKQILVFYSITSSFLVSKLRVL